MNIHPYLDISEGDPWDQALSVMYQDYREGKNIEGLSAEEAACVIALGFARYVLNHPVELAARIKEMERAEQARMEK